MDSSFPDVLGAGLFDSRLRYPGVTMTQDRCVDIYELELFCENNGTAYLNGRQYPMSRGDVMLSRPGDVRRSALHFSCRYIHFAAADGRIRELLADLPTFLPGDHTEELSELFDAVICPGRDRFTALRETEALLRLLLAVEELSAGRLRQSAALRRTDERIEAAALFMQANFCQRIDVDAVAKHCLLSTSHFYRRFFDTMGVSPKSYLNSLRITEAKRLLMSPKYTVAVVAEKCGFTSQAYFCSCFKKSVGVPPSVYRRSTGYRL